jgi:hypothetical protein
MDDSEITNNYPLVLFTKTRFLAKVTVGGNTDMAYLLVVPAIGIVYLAGKGALVALDQTFRWLADRNGF